MSSVVAARSLVARLRTTMHKMSYMPHHGIRQIGPASSSSNNTTITPIAYCCHDQFITRQRLFSSVSSKPNPSSSDSTNSTSTKPTTTSTSTSTTDASSSNSDTTTTPVDAETITKQVDALMSEAANRATRYVYLRTLPLSEQSVFSNYTTSDLKSIGDAIETRVRIVLSSQLTKTHHHNNDNSLQITPGSRTAVHVHTAALAVATWHVLHPGWIPDEQRVINMIRRAFGAPVLEEDGMTDEEKLTLNDGLTARLDYWVVRTALWFAFDKMMAVKRMTKNTMSDFGADFKMRVDDGVVGGLEQHILSVDKCVYRQVCKSEGVPQLTSIFCALDRQTFSALNAKRHGIRFTLDQTLADNDVTPAADSSSSSSTSSSTVATPCEFKFVKLKKQD